MRRNEIAIALVSLSMFHCGTVVEAAEPRVPLRVEDLAALRDVAEPRLSPDRVWVAFTVTQDKVAADRRATTVWVVKLDGTLAHPLAPLQDDASTLRWSPDGRTLGFLSSRGTQEGRSQLWFVDPATASAALATPVDGNVTDFAWAPDGRRIALVVQSAASPALTISPDGTPIPQPIIVDRFYFKEDVTGYLGRERQQLRLLDRETGHITPLTSGSYDATKPSWSPDGHTLAFVSKRGEDPDRHATYGIYAMAANAGAAERLVATYQGSTYQGDAASDWTGPPAWSPDGRWLAYVTAGDPRLIFYSVHQLAVVPILGGAARMLAPALDRNVSVPQWSRDGRSLLALVEDAGNSHLVRFDAQSGARTTVLSGRRSTSAFDVGPRDTIIILDSTPKAPPEVYGVIDGSLRNLSKQNDALLSRVELGEVDEIAWPSADSTTIRGFLTKPPDYTAGHAYPTILHLHGGPTSQFDNGFDFEQQLLAAQGYVVVAPNPRGSAGRGELFAAAIYADWGNKDSSDALSAINALVARGISDPDRLGIGGWSYGGMLTNYIIARDGRFKAAISGAALGNQLAAYGTDMYVREYEAELGPPWKNPQLWLKVSFPFFEADHITTPTLFLCGSLDFSVPLLHSEQMYEALKSLGRDTTLIVYPGQSHSFVRPSFRRDRLERYVAWYDRQLHPARSSPERKSP
jgi:dipeptidyl aminopeptidase/acylaminoacyl peptidase